MRNILYKRNFEENFVYKCICDYKDPITNTTYVKGDIVMGDDLDDITELNKPFFKMVGGLGITHDYDENGNIIELKRRPVEVGDVFNVKFLHISKKNVVVLDILEKEELAVVYPYNIGYLPLGPLVREEHVGWMGVNWDLDFGPKYLPVESNKDELN